MSGSVFTWLPERASTHAFQVDLLFLTILCVATLVSILIIVLILFFSICYRGSLTKKPLGGVTPNTLLEVTWTLIPLIFFLSIFVWGTKLYIDSSVPPKDAIQISVVGKQWMWKLEHTDGRREINELHVPVHRAVQLTMISQDVIHSFFVPAFRVKQDVLPGRYSTLWFQAEKPGRYHIFCSQYCGTKHAAMTGEVIVMEPARYEEWLSGSSPSSSPAEEGEKLFGNLGCVTCHESGVLQQGPKLTGLYGRKVFLQDGSTIMADASYIRESILDPGAKVVRGFENRMPSYRGTVTEEEILKLIAYIRTLGILNEGVQNGAK